MAKRTLKVALKDKELAAKDAKRVKGGAAAEVLVGIDFRPAGIAGAVGPESPLKASSLLGKK